MSPMYEYLCPECEELSIWFGPWEDRPKVIPCEECGKEARYSIAPMARMAWQWGATWNEDILLGVEGVKEACAGKSYCPDAAAGKRAKEENNERMLAAEKEIKNA
jgi:hypothetical protein